MSHKKHLYLTSVHLKNVRGFSDVTLELGTSAEPRMWTVLLGNNGDGKSTLLRAIAIGLGNESVASALLSEVHGSLIRRNKQGNEEKSALIVLNLTDGTKKSPAFHITTEIYRDASKQTVVRKHTEPAESFPWDDLFVCGYGVNRSTRGDSQKPETYNLRDNVLSLFLDRSNLLDPEKVLQDLDYRRLKQEQGGKANFMAAKKHLSRVLPLRPKDKIDVDQTGITVKQAWGTFHLRTLGDGYQGTVGWIADFLGVAWRAKQSLDRWSLRGIVLIDEVDEHLHPSWQRDIIPRLRKTFPLVQFLITTHSPMTLVNTDKGEVFVAEVRNTVSEVRALADVHGKTADEILQGEWFGLPSTLDDESASAIAAYRQAFLDHKPEEELEEQRQELRTRIGSFVTSPMDALAQRIADTLRKQLAAEQSVAERQRLIEKAAAELRAELSGQVPTKKRGG